jgi:hypothetical protein
MTESSRYEHVVALKRSGFKSPQPTKNNSGIFGLPSFSEPLKVAHEAQISQFIVDCLACEISGGKAVHSPAHILTLEL